MNILDKKIYEATLAYITVLKDQQINLKHVNESKTKAQNLS